MNNLIHETSPYLLQHARNPVNWFAWNSEAFEKAKSEDKLILISIGYSSCHWCHVMEHESFEDMPTAKLMNENFVCIKVDREERPDVDAVYMSAVQLMTGRGGWPLNCFALPDGRPIYGGTYFPKAPWQNVLVQLTQMYKHDKKKFLMYADDLVNGIKKTDSLIVANAEVEFSKTTIEKTITNWKKHFDDIEGGPNRAPKFPLPNNYIFLLRYATLAKDNEVLKHVLLTLDKMTYGGIYDHVGGGFARYSTDSLWKVPHFEKMLYDNAQMISLYAEAYTATKNPLYKNVVYETANFIEREMKSDKGFFYSALDADSEGEEGRFYVWRKEDVEKIISNIEYRILNIEVKDVVRDYFSINENGYWEGNYILLRREDDDAIAKRYNISVDELNELISHAKNLLLEERNKRTRPGLDDKSLTSWNALMIDGLCVAHRAFNENKFLELAINNAELLLAKQLKPDGSLYHSYKIGKSTINGFLEDYCFTIEAFISLYQSCFDERWLYEADKLIQYVLKHFSDEETGMFFFTSDIGEQLITRKREIQDNVIPASNSSIAKGLFLLGKYFDKTEYISRSEKMLRNMVADMATYGSAYSNWGILLLQKVFPFYEIAITGNDFEKRLIELQQNYLPNIIVTATNKESELPLLKNRLIKDKTLIYVCENNACKLPVEEMDWKK